MIVLRLVFAVCFILVALSNAQAGKRVALVIGNSAYSHVPHLANPANDATDIATSLARLGFDVTRAHDLEFDEMRRALGQFSQKVLGSEMALVFYAGHGIEVNKQNYLIPTDAKLATDLAISYEAIPLELVTEAVSGAKGLKLVVLDACRNNPFVASMNLTSTTRSIGRGLARVEPVAGTLVAFAAKEGTEADDGQGRNSPYTKALLQYLEQPGLEINFLFRKVRDSVMAQTNNRQQPFTYGSLPGTEIFLKEPQNRPLAEEADELRRKLLELQKKLDASAQSNAVTTSNRSKRTERINRSKLTEKPARGAPMDAPAGKQASVEPLGPVPTVSAIGQKAYLYEESIGDQVATRDNASIVWSLAQQSPGGDMPPEAVILGHYEVPGRGLTMDISIKRNVDENLSASHIIELVFETPPDFSGGSIDTLARFVMKANEQARGEPLVAVPVKIDSGLFMIALNNLEQAQESNRRLLLDSNWIDIPIGYPTGRRALATLEIGNSGKKIFREALKEWEKRG